MASDRLLKKYDELKKYLQSLGSAAIAFSGGVDSTFLLFAAHEALGENTAAVTVASRSFPARETEEAARFCTAHGIRSITVRSDELSIDGIRSNPKNRCYLCKKEIFRQIKKAAADAGMQEVTEGSNLDDNGDYRPGLAAVAELGVKSPLRHIGFTKAEIRELSHYLCLPTWNKPSYACLMSRFPYGEEITEEKLAMVDTAEQLLLDIGFSQMRVRIHGTIARIELLPTEFERMMQDDIRLKVYAALKEAGFSYVTLDLLGYRTGSMNETLTDEERKL